MAEKEGSSSGLPDWMNNILTVLGGYTHINVQVFLLKVIINRSQVFKPKLGKFFEAIVKVILFFVVAPQSRHIPANNCQIGIRISPETKDFTSFNYFLRDICLLILSSEVALDTVAKKEAARSFLVPEPIPSLFGFYWIVIRNIC